jgi:aminoglycoside 3-N-acetyltransferase I
LRVSYSFEQLTSGDLPRARGLLAVFERAFGEADAGGERPPDDDHLAAVLGKPNVVALVALDGATVVGGLVAYELDKLEQPRSEIYIYDLAVDEAHRRRGVAIGLIGALRAIARQRGARVMFVQADRADLPAVRLYESIGTRADVHQFDIPVDP